MKTFVLDARVHRRRDVDIFRQMLRAVNNRVVSPNREFRSRRGFPILLSPRRIGISAWEKLAWPASHQRFFRLGHWRIEDEEFRRPMQRLWRRGYKLVDDWWLQEIIQPVMVTHQRVDLPDVKSRLAEIEAHMLNTCGWKKLRRLYGRSEWWRDLSSSAPELRAASNLASED